jgi:hypothetical protein
MQKEDATMRAMLITMLAGVAIGLFGASEISAAPASGAVIGATAAAGQAIEQARDYRRHHRRRAPYAARVPYAPMGSYGGASAHQQSQENETRALQNWNGGIK